MTTYLYRLSVSAVLLLLLGVGAFAVAGSAQAATSGDLIKCSSGSSVYLLGEDGKRYAFPNEKVFFSWNEGFNEVKVVTCADLAGIQFGGLVPYQAGTRLVKIPSVPKVYVVTSGGVLRPIKDEEMARKLFGDDWAQRIDDLPESFFPRYTVDAELADDELPEGTIVTADDGSVLRVDDNGEAVEIEDVVDEDKLRVLKKHAQASHRLENRLGKVIRKIRKLERQIDKLQEQLLKLKAIQVDDEEKVELDDIKEATDEEIAQDREEFKVDEQEAKEAAEEEARKKAEAEKDAQDEDSGTQADGSVDVNSDSSGSDTKLPDLRVTDLSLSSTNQVTVTLDNNGSVDVATENVDIHIWLDDVLEWTYNATTLASNAKGFLTAGNSSYIQPQVIEGTREVKACVDYLEVIDEADDTNNCLYGTLFAPDGDFEVQNVGTFMLDENGDSDQVLRTFSFDTTGPLDHYRIRIWDAAGALHDELVQQVIGSSDTSFYVSPSWLTPLNELSSYAYEIHAEEYQTGDAADSNGTFVTGSTGLVASLTVSQHVSTPSGASIPGLNEVLRFNVSATVESDITNIKFAISSSDNESSDWNTCGNLGVLPNLSLYRYSDLSTELTAGYSFTSIFNGVCPVVPTADLGHANLLISNETINAGETVTYSLFADTTGASSKGDDTIRFDISDESAFLWNDDAGNSYDGNDASGFPVTGGTLIY